jgi:hypothetical protein
MKEEQKHQASQFGELRGSIDTEPADREFDSLNDMSKIKAMPSHQIAENKFESMQQMNRTSD